MEDEKVLSDFSPNAVSSDFARYAISSSLNKDAYLIHGHTHSTRKLDFLRYNIIDEKYYQDSYREINVAWDAWKGPVSMEELEKFMDIIEDNYSPWLF